MPPRRRRDSVDGPSRGSSTESDESSASSRAEHPRVLARKIVLRRLDAAPRTRVELHEYLADRDIPTDVIGEVLDRFEEVGLIDDALYARMWVRSRHEHRGHSRYVLRQDLRRKGVADQVIAESMETISDHEERDRARLLVERKFASQARFEPAVQERRLVSMLARKGYPTGMCFAVVREALSDQALELSDALSDASANEG